MICQKCGNDIRSGTTYCIKCGFNFSSVSAEQAIPTYQYLDRYYQNEFRKIYESKELYKGKLNWAAFCFGLLWAFSKGLYLNAILWVLLVVFTGGIAGLFGCFYYGYRGNWLYYNLSKNDSQPFL